MTSTVAAALTTMAAGLPPNLTTSPPPADIDWNNLAKSLNETEISLLWHVDPVGTTLYIIVLVFMTVLGTVGNLLIIAATMMVRELRKPGNLFIVSMAVSDLLVSCITNPFAVIGTLYGKAWFLDGRWHMCIFLGSMCLLACACSLLTILFIAFNRYIALLHHVHYSRIFTWKTCTAMAIFCWVASGMLVVPLHFGWGGHRYDEKGMMCIFDRNADYSFNVVLVCVIVLVPVTAIFYFYLSIFLHVHKKKKAIAAARGDKGKDKDSSSKEAKLARTLFIIFMGFFICWIPFAIVCLFDFADTWPKEVYLFVFTLDHFSGSGLNFILYGVTNGNFRKGYRRVVARTVPRCLARLCLKPEDFMEHSVTGQASLVSGATKVSAYKSTAAAAT